MILTQDEYIDRIAQRAVTNKNIIERDLFQRRNQVVDLDGVEYMRQGGPGLPATFYIAISPDMVYMERFEFKLIISAFIGTGGLTPDLHPVPVTASDFRVKVEGIDITAYLAAQHNGWISGEGVWPAVDILKTYDVLEAASDMCAAGEAANADKLVKPGYKKIEVTSGSLFAATMSLYCKYSHLNR